MFFNTKNILSYQVKVLLKNIFTLPRFQGEENFLRIIVSIYPQGKNVLGV